MSNYHVWNPSLDSIAPPVVRLFLTHAEMSNIGTGTDAFIAACLAAAGVTGTVLRWTLDRYRTGYFTEYPDEDGPWNDRWQPCYRIRAEMADGVVFRGDAFDGKYPCDAIDDSWSRASADPDAPDARCLILADFTTEAALEEARVVVAEWAETIRIGTAMGSYRQLELELGMRTQAFYDGGDALAKELVAMCRDLGGYTHYFDATAAKLRATR